MFMNILPTGDRLQHRRMTGMLMGVVQACTYSKFKASNVEDAEYRADEVAVKFIASFDLDHVIFEGGCNVVVDCLQSGSLEVGWSSRTVVENILHICNGFSSFIFKWCSRDCNNLAHDLAAWDKDRSNCTPPPDFCLNSVITMILI
ncbi:hypothetical protein FRX31_014932 [Thalictrum thalictroides]|uniref:RNase H type-1 domain-containing protein n=1 Tax=Thalictrum thalictroides TaxID=46969 RepID=A0A7J6WFW4_THATH|nr:hypothetical protein FRX31_014932 [Thalictrum thalictroides]